jgi:hypothetical protein
MTPFRAGCHKKVSNNPFSVQRRLNAIGLNEMTSDPRRAIIRRSTSNLLSKFREVPQ